MKRLILGSVLAAFLLIGISFALPVQTRPQPAQAQQPANECPADTPKGAYHVQGYDDETGAAICGFTYFNECPYFAGAEAGTPECEKGKPTAQQLEPWQPEDQPKTAPLSAQCGGK